MKIENTKKIEKLFNLGISGGRQVLQVAKASGKFSTRKEGIRRMERYLALAKKGKTKKVLIVLPDTTTDGEIRALNNAMKKRGCVLAFVWEEPIKFKWLGKKKK